MGHAIAAEDLQGVVGHLERVLGCGDLGRNRAVHSGPWCCHIVFYGPHNSCSSHFYFAEHVKQAIAHILVLDNRYAALLAFMGISQGMLVGSPEPGR